MARTLNEIQNLILDKKEQTAELSTLQVLTESKKNTIQNLASTSKVGIWRLWVYVFAFAIWTLEKLFDTHKLEVSQKNPRKQNPQLPVV